MSWRTLLERQGVDPGRLRDPWGSLYCAQLTIRGAKRRLTLRSADVESSVASAFRDAGAFGAVADL